jgi:hypothetical protein
VIVPSDAAVVHRVRASVICRLAADAAPLAREGVVPDYRRLPDAQTTPRNRPTTLEK